MSLLSLCSPGEYQIRGPVSNIEPPGGLIYEANLVYRGAFRLPQYPIRYDASARGMYYYAPHDSLFIVGQSNTYIVGEVAVPSLASLDDTPASIASLQIATGIQDPIDPTEWNILNLDKPGSAPLHGGVLVHNGKLIVASYRFYDASPPFASLTHFVCGLDLTYESGPWQIGPTQQAGLHGGYMCDVPSEWVDALGGYPCLTGLVTENIVTRTSQGATIHGFDPSELGVTVPPAIQTLMYYPDEHPFGGLGYNVTGNDRQVHLDYNQTFAIGGVVFPGGSWRGVLFIGSIGTGISKYGNGTADIDLDDVEVFTVTGNPADIGLYYCYDPVNFAHGGHAYPYKTRIYAYDANDLAAVANGADPWSIAPYAMWTVTPPFDSYWPKIAGAAYDPIGGRIFISQEVADGDGPLIHVYTLA